LERERMILFGESGLTARNMSARLDDGGTGTWRGMIGLLHSSTVHVYVGDPMSPRSKTRKAAVTVIF
jgi:hypothetical protein